MKQAVANTTLVLTVLLAAACAGSVYAAHFKWKWGWKRRRWSDAR
jgi:hypothetical protein